MRLADIAPELVSELTTGLIAQGRLDLAKQLELVEILQCTYDEFADAGTIYFARPRPSWYFEKLSAPVKETIGIGAGPECDAQVLVWQDMAGLRRGSAPRFVKRYADLHAVLTQAAAAFVAEIRDGEFPGPEHTHH